MSAYYTALSEKLRTRFGAQLKSCHVAHGEVTIEVSPSELLQLCTALRDEDDFHYEILIDVCGMDYSAYRNGDWKGERFAAVYHLLSVKNNHRLRVRCFADGEMPVIPSVVDIWSSADWFEREAFDLYGILFEGHPDLRRILTDYGFIGHPFRKDFPLSGNVEMRFDAEKNRVVYEPVSIEPRDMVPRVIGDDHRYEHGSNKGEA